MRSAQRKVSQRNERGVSAVLVAIVGVMMIGCAAFVVDTAALYAERRELQGGADAAALSLAIQCADGTCPDLNAGAEEYVDLNSKDGQSTASAQLLGGNRIEVINRTRDVGSNTDGDATTVDFSFAQIFGLGGSAVSARAVASWENASGGATLPLTFSLCEWQKSVQLVNGQLVGLTPGPLYSGPLDVIFFHVPGGNGNGNGNGNQGAPSCPAGPAGQDVPGGFGWLDAPTTCSATVTGFGFVGGSTGVPAPNTCSPAKLIGKTVLLPIFDSVVGNGNNNTYHIYGYAGFHITGFQLGGNGNEWTVNPPNVCNANKRCIGGYFVSFTQGATAGSVGGVGPNLGAKTVKLTE
jgi:Flp pilus assembly protein TadG